MRNCILQTFPGELYFSRRGISLESTLACRKDEPLCGRLAGHRRNFHQVHPCDEHGYRGHSSPAVQIPARSDELHFRTKREIEDQLRGAAIELLRQLQQRPFGPSLSIGGTPDRYVQRFLLNLIGDGKAAEKRASRALADVERGAVAAGFHARVGGNEL